MDRESIMKQWDSWREYIAGGGKGSWPRDAFESLLDYFEESIRSASQQVVEDGAAIADSPEVCPHCGDCLWLCEVRQSITRRPLNFAFAPPAAARMAS